MATQLDLNELTNVTTVTKGTSDGTGAFDKLMNTVNLYLDDQYSSGRLKGTDYANVLLGSIQTAMQQSLQYTLQNKLIAAQTDQALEQVKATYTERVIKDKQAVDLGLDNAYALAKNAKEADAAYVYTPYYEEVI